MSAYVYSSYLRRKAQEIFASAGEEFRVVIIGARPQEKLLFSKIATITSLPSLSGGDVDPNHVLGADAIFCGFIDLPHLQRLFQSQRYSSTTSRVISVRDRVSRLNADVFADMHGLCRQQRLEVFSYQSAMLDHVNDKELTFVLKTRLGKSGEHPGTLLKIAVILESHSLHHAATDMVRQYNQTVSIITDKVDEQSIDRTYEVEAYAYGDYNQQIGHEAERRGIGNEEKSQLLLDVRNKVSTVVGPSTVPLLSIHFDALHQADGQNELVRLSRSVVDPARTEIIVRVPGDATPASISEIAEMISKRDITIKLFHDPAVKSKANPSALGFVESMSATVSLAAYYDGQCMPVQPGWDHDVLRVAGSIIESIYLLKLSQYKTRYYSTTIDAFEGSEDFPVVSRSWLETCGAWSVPDISAGTFQTLVAYYFDRIDWTNKHRTLRLVPVMMVQTQEAEKKLPSSEAPVIAGRRSALMKAEEVAARIALTLQARDWAERRGVGQVRMEYNPRLRTLSLREQSWNTLLRKWSFPRGRLRLPL